ncbi:hypothetical protein BegalDRAFT_3563 [Beggiatoa alba B18LD]|uniref:Uncharacterized protein n=1 Tax=Beggiatoa alba B18LD TaxID=395493 RepID=I3CBD6_9GAMM|nr:hypothetical protein [Beggiatoa alba]EIJ40929.1 hypothetical protein BegalDRAFT_3563 [Beggiatoa alba B18LD]
MNTFLRLGNEFISLNDLMHVKPNDDLTIDFYYKSGCAPAGINPVTIKPNDTNEHVNFLKEIEEYLC